MSSWWGWIRSEPVALTEAVRAVVAALIVFGAIDWTGEQVGAFMLAFSLVFGVIVRQNVTPTINLGSSSRPGKPRRR